MELLQELNELAHANYLELFLIKLTQYVLADIINLMHKWYAKSYALESESF